MQVHEFLLYMVNFLDNLPHPHPAWLTFLFCSLHEIRRTCRSIFTASNWLTGRPKFARRSWKQQVCCRVQTLAVLPSPLTLRLSHQLRIIGDSTALTSHPCHLLHPRIENQHSLNLLQISRCKVQLNDLATTSCHAFLFLSPSPLLLYPVIHPALYPY